MLKAVPFRVFQKAPRQHFRVLGREIGRFLPDGEKLAEPAPGGTAVDGKVDIGTVIILSKFEISVDVGQNVFAHVVNAAN